MPFDTFSPKLKRVAQAGQKYLTSRYGKNGLKLEEEIDPAISLRPTIQLKLNKAQIIAAVVSDSLYPASLKVAGHDILRFDFPIAVYLICALDIYQADKGQKVTGELRRHGFGILTVDDEANVVQQCACIPLAQFLSEEEMAPDLSALTPKLKVAFRTAHGTYVTNEGQGLQACGQIVEALVRSLARGAATKGLITAPPKGTATADLIDELYSKNAFKDSRATLGGARDFIKEYRNIASHPADTAKQAMTKIRKCKKGFLDALRVAKNLIDVHSEKAYRIELHVT
jgi:hypothetical protein